MAGSTPVPPSLVRHRKGFAPRSGGAREEVRALGPVRVRVTKRKDRQPPNEQHAKGTGIGTVLP